jgi:radical SAM protein (TIGR01212 family)
VRPPLAQVSLYAAVQVPSTKPLTSNLQEASWRRAGLRYYSYNDFLRQRFGVRVQKVSVDAGFTCPNVDGTVAKGGCTFCDNRSFSPSRRLPRAGILGQIDQSIDRMQVRYQNCQHFLAYFQPATNTYAPVERLRPLYEEALSHPQVVGLAIGTRSDCVPEETLDLLEEFAGRSYLAVEYGMQTMHDRSLVWMNRGHDHASFLDAVERSRGRGFEICAHVMLGLPGETHEDMLATARELARVNIDAVKIHNLYCVKNTRLADQVAAGEVQLMGREEYVRTVVDFIELLPPTMVIERISGDAPPDYFIGPSWCLDKPAVKLAIEAEFARRDSYQGLRHQSAHITPLISANGR